MHTGNKVYIKMGSGWSLVGTARMEEDAATGTKMLHLRMAALASDVYVTMTEVSALHAHLHEEAAVLLEAAVVGHA